MPAQPLVINRPVVVLLSVETNDRLDGNVVCSVGNQTITCNFTGTGSAER